jgi:hypothetical protein
MSGVKNHYYTNNSQTSGYSTRDTYADQIAEQQRLERAREAQRARLREQMNQLNNSLKAPISQINAQLSSTMRDLNQQLSSAYSSMSQSTNNVEMDIKVSIQQMNTKVNQAFKDYSLKSNQALKLFQDELEKSSNTKQQNITLLKQNIQALFEKLAILKNYDTKQTSHQLSLSMNEANQLIDIAPQAAIGTMHQILLKSNQTLQQLQQLAYEDQANKASLIKDLGSLESNIEAAKNLQYDTLISGQMELKNADIDYWTNNQLTAITERLNQLKRYSQENALDDNKREDISNQITALQKTLIQLTADAKNSLLSDLTAKRNANIFIELLASIGWKYDEDHNLLNPLDYQLHFFNAKGHIFKISLDKNLFRTEMFSNNEQEDLMMDKERIDYELKRAILGNTIDSKPNSVCDGPIEVASEELRQRLNKKVLYASVKPKK